MDLTVKPYVIEERGNGAVCVYADKDIIAVLDDHPALYPIHKWKDYTSYFVNPRYKKDEVIQDIKDTLDAAIAAKEAAEEEEEKFARAVYSIYFPPFRYY